MPWDIEVTDEFKAWWTGLTEDEQNEITAVVELLEEHGTRLQFPHSSNIKESRHSHMRELRVQCAGKPIRVFYAFDPRRTAILLNGGNKTGSNRFYKKLVPQADQLYDKYLQELKDEGEIN